MEKQLRKYIAPNILAMVGTSCYVLADTFFISIAAGANGITALNLVLPIYGLIFALGSMIGVGSATRYSLHRSVGNPDARDYFSNSVWFTLLVSCIFVAAGIWFPDRVLTLLGADAEILQIGLTYTQIVLCFAPFFMLNYTFTAFVRNDNAPKLAMAATLTSGIFNIAFDYIFMFPMKMGMVGAALATGISPIVSMSVCMIHYLSKNSTIVFTWKLPSVKRFLSSCTLGVAAFVGELSSGITTMVFNFILLGLSGNTAVAAYGVIANIALVGTALFNGVSLGLQPVASSVHGQMNSDGEKRIYRHSLQISLVIACLLVGAVMLFAESMVAVFNSENSHQLAVYAVPGLRLYVLGFLIAAINIIKAGFFSAVGKGLESSVIAISRGIVSITVMAFLLSRFFGITGVWLAFPASEAVTWVLSVLMEKMQNKKVPHTLDTDI